jgi:hypothetical protein
VKFYSENFGLSLINKLSFPEAKFDLFFLAYNDSAKSESKDNHWSDREGVLELTYNCMFPPARALFLAIDPRNKMLTKLNSRRHRE